MSDKVENDDLELEEGFSFEITENTETEEEGQGQKLQPGIHENVYLESIEYITPDKDDSKWEQALEFRFVCKGTNFERDSHGNLITDAKGNKKIISRAGETINARQFFSDSSMDQKKFQNLLKRIKHIMVKFVPHDKAVVKGKNFQDMCKNIIKILKGTYEDVPLRLKVVANGRYSQVPYYMPFVERQEKGKPTKLSISNKELKVESADVLNDLSDDNEIELDM